jgi:hypothetical protein
MYWGLLLTGFTENNKKIMISIAYAEDVLPHFLG